VKAYRKELFMKSVTLHSSVHLRTMIIEATIVNASPLMAKETDNVNTEYEMDMILNQGRACCTMIPDTSEEVSTLRVYAT